MERQKYNKLILDRLFKLVEKYPELRFGQFLVNANIITYKHDYDEIVPIDPLYEESSTMWNRMKDSKFAFYEQYN